MFNYKLIFGFAAGLLLTILIGTSCKKTGAPDYGVPVITRVGQPTDSVGHIVNIDSGVFSQWVVIYGLHLGSTQSVSFNDDTVSYKTIYASDTSVTAQIPRVIPKNATNTITIVTRGGTATFKFTVIPTLTLTGMVNEWTLPGDTLVLTGQNFDLLDPAVTSVSFTGGATANMVGSSATQAKVIVPADAGVGPVTLKSGSISLTSIGWFHDNRNFFVDMSNLSLDNGPAFVSSGPDPAPINGPYFKVAKSWQANFNWDPFFAGYVAIPAELVNDPTQYVNYAVKFEMNIPVGPPSLPLKLYLAFNGGDFRENFFDVSGNNTYPFNTGGQWETFTATLSTWTGTGGMANYVFTNPVYFDIMLKDANASQSNFSICNLRLVRIN